MTKTIKIIDPSEDKRWDDFILTHEKSSIYHHSLWKDVLQISYGYRPMYFILEEDNKIIAGIPLMLVKSIITGKRLVSLPFSDHCDILVKNEKDFDILLRAIIKESKVIGSSFVEFKVKNTSIILSNLRLKETTCHINHVLKLNKPLDEIMRGFHRSCIRQCIQKAINNNLVIVSGKQESDLKIFYELYVLTRKRKGLPPQPYRFFKNMWYILHAHNMFYIYLVYDNLVPIGGLIFTKYKDTMCALYNGSLIDQRFKRPNHLLFWKAIEFAKQEGLKEFDFGRTSPENHGLMKFKKRWGTDEHDIICFKYGKSIKDITLVNRRKFKKDSISHFAKFLPKSFFKITGRIIYRHLG